MTSPLKKLLLVTAATATVFTAVSARSQMFAADAVVDDCSAVASCAAPQATSSAARTLYEGGKQFWQRAAFVRAG